MHAHRPRIKAGLIVVAALIGVALHLLGISRAEAAPVHRLAVVIDRPVVDLARVLSPDDDQKLTKRLAHFRDDHRVQVAVLIVPSIQDEDIADLGHRTAQAWRGGDHGADSGVLIVLDVGDRKSRIEVGKGLEGALTDLETHDILEHVRKDLSAGHYAEGLGRILDEVFAKTQSASTAARDGSDAAKWRESEEAKIDHPGGIPMPQSILIVLTAGLAASTLITLRLPFWGRGGLVLLVLGAVGVPLVTRAVPFWPAFLAPWVLGILAGAAVGKLAREERLTALLLFASAVGAMPLGLLRYKAMTGWTPPWGSTDVLFITGIELVLLAIGTWVVAFALLLVLGLLIAVPINIAAKFSPSLSATRGAVNTWFGDRLGIVMGIFGLISETAGRTERQPMDHNRQTDRSRREKVDYRGGGGEFGGGGSNDDF